MDQWKKRILKDEMIDTFVCIEEAAYSRSVTRRLLVVVGAGLIGA